MAKRADGRVDCPACGHHGSRCQEDLDDGTTYCHETGATLDPCEQCQTLTADVVELHMGGDFVRLCQDCAKGGK